jgi:hypothetical protein
MFLLSFATLAAQPATTPLTLTLPHCTLPSWVDARIAIDAQGQPDTRYFGKDHRIADILAGQTEGGCHAVGPWFVDVPAPPPRGSLQQAIANSEAAVLGRVTGKSYGFYGSVPGQMLQIRPERVMGAKLTKKTYYYFVPVATFTLGSTTICKTDWRYAAPAEVGQEVFIFAKVPIDHDGVLLNVLGPGDVVNVSSTGELQLPKQYQPARSGAHTTLAATVEPVSTRGALLNELLRVRGGEVRK